MHRTLHKLATWLVLTAYLLTGFAPGQQLVVCLEPDGTVALEAATDGGCTPCGDPEQFSSETVRAECCPCTDIPLPMQSDDPQVKLKRSQTHDPSATGIPLACVPAVASAWHPRSISRESGPPRPAPSLALIRTVVLRV